MKVLCVRELMLGRELAGINAFWLGYRVAEEHEHDDLKENAKGHHPALP
jgi:hypothetical protein